MPRRSLSRPALAVAAAAVLGAATGAATYAVLDSGGTTTVVRQVTVADGTSTAASGSTLTPAKVYDRAAASVVEITVTTGGSFGPGNGQTAQGSGFVYDTAGHVITNEHVVDGANTVSVRFANGASYQASVVATDTSSDLAVLKVDAPAALLRPLALADSSTVVVGQPVVAIGSPFGLEGSLTSGIVSALHRQMTAQNGFAIDDSIQTDAAINHGNSGGPLLDLRGRVVGVNAQIESDSGGNDGVGFAVPSNTVRHVVSQLLAGEQVQYAYLGVSVENATNANGSGAGARVTSVRTGTPAASAGLQTGDVVVTIQGRTVEGADELRSAVASRKPGDKLTLTVVRDGNRKTVTVTLAERPS